METMKLLAHIGTDGILQIQTHTELGVAELGYDWGKGAMPTERFAIAKK